MTLPERHAMRLDVFSRHEQVVNFMGTVIAYCEENGVALGSPLYKEAVRLLTFLLDNGGDCPVEALQEAMNGRDL